MPFPSRPLYLTWGGTIGTPSANADVWQCGLHFGMAGPAQPDLPTQSELDTWWNNTVKPFHTLDTLHLSGGAWLCWAKAVVLTESGSYATEPVIYNGTPVHGSDNFQAGSPSEALAISLSSGETLGQGNHGRFYLPWYVGGSEVATGRMSAPQVAQVVTAAAAFVQNTVAWVHAASGGDVGLRIFSSVGGGSKKLVTKLSVGDVVDVQRRRRNRLKESYQSAGIVP